MRILPPLIEPAIISDTFVTGLSHIEHVGGGCLRFVFYVERVLDGVPHRIVVERIVMPTDRLGEAVAMTMAAMNGSETREQDAVAH